MEVIETTQNYSASDLPSGVAVIIETLQPRRLLTDAQLQYFEIIFYVFLCTMIGLFGITANIINIIIFFKQGFSFTVNISLCGLAISDLCCLTTEMWTNISVNPLLKKADIPFVPGEVQYLTGGIPTVVFTRITCWITVFITAERCLSIALPLKVKQIITAKRTVVIIFCIYFLNFLAFSPQYTTSYFGWKFYPHKNRTLLGLVNRGNANTDIVLYMATSMIGLVSFIAVIIFTSILVVKLNQKSAWRTTVTAANEQSESMTNRDKRTVKMVILIATILICCYTPGVMISLATVFEPRFILAGQFSNAYFASWGIGLVAQNINSSVNIFLYYNMSTKYRQTFQVLFTKCRRGESAAKTKIPNGRK